MRIAVIGLGFMGSTHLRAWQNVADARVAAVYSDDEQKLTGDLSQVQGNLGGTTGKLDFFRRSQVPRYWRAPERSRYRCGGYLPADFSSRADQDRRGACGKTCAGREADGAHRRAGGRDDRRGEEGAAHADDGAGTALFIPSYRALYDAVRSGKFGKVRAALLRRRCAAPFWNSGSAMKERAEAACSTSHPRCRLLPRDVWNSGGGVGNRL